MAEPTLSGDGTQWTPPTWDELVREHADRVYQLAYRLTGNQHDAEDLTQETFVRAFRSMSTLKPNTVEGWLRRITTNLFLDMVRRRARVRMEHSPADSKLDSDGRITEDLESIQERIDSVLTGLREDQLTISEQLHRTG